MLSETFLAASSAAPRQTSANSTLLKDSGIFVHAFQPQPALRATFKKSATSSNGLAVSDSHCYAAQLGKAVVHVYNRERGNQEATVPFPERILSIVLALDETILVAGTDGGRLILWDTRSGRYTSTAASHLQGVNVVAADTSGHFVLSGAGDATVLVWSLLDLLSFSGTSHTSKENRNPRHTLNGHNAAITAVALGHSAAASNIAVTGAKDNTAVVWDYVTGQKLRTILLELSPLCLEIDPADRAVYAGYEDGSVQRIDFYSLTDSSSLVRSLTKSATALQLPAQSRWNSCSPNSSEGQATSVLSLALSYDGSTLLSGHSSGSISTWEIASGRFTGTLAQYPGAPISNLLMQRPSGFLRSECSQTRTAHVVKPRPHEPFSAANGGVTDASYMYQAALTSHVVPPRLRRRHTQVVDYFSQALQGPGFPLATLDFNPTVTGLSSAQVVSVANGSNGNQAFDPFEDFVPVSSAIEERAEELQARLQRIEQIIAAKDAVIEKVQRERNDSTFRERQTLARRAHKLKQREQRHEMLWQARQSDHYGKSLKTEANGSRSEQMKNATANGLIATEDEISEPSTTSASEEWSEEGSLSGLTSRERTSAEGPRNQWDSEEDGEDGSDTENDFEVSDVENGDIRMIDGQ